MRAKYSTLCSLLPSTVLKDLNQQVMRCKYKGAATPRNLTACRGSWRVAPPRSGAELYINGLSCLTSLSTKVEQITAVFTAATRQKAWDHFTKAQRKNIDIWRKQCEELRNAHSEEIMGIRREEEMEMSDEDLEENPCKKVRMEDSALAVQTCALREENDSLRWQLDAYRNEVELLKKEQGKAQRADDEHMHDNQLHFLQQSMHGMQQSRA